MTRYLKFMAAAVPFLAVSFAFGEITGSKHDFSAATWSDNQICKPCHTPHNADISLTGRIWAHTLSTATYKYHGGSVPGDGSTSTDAGTGSVTQTGMDNATRLCLSCHDGTVALDSFKGKDGGFGTTSIDTLKSADGSYNPNLGGTGAQPDLSNDHPVGYSAKYDEWSGITFNPDGTTSGEYRYKPIDNVLNVKKLKMAISTNLYTTDPNKQAGRTTGVTPYGQYPKGGTTTTNNYYSVSCVTCHNVHNAGAPEERGLLRISNAGSDLCLSCHNK